MDRPERATLGAQPLRSSGSVGRAGLVKGRESCLIVAGPPASPEIPSAGKKRQEKPGQPLRLLGRGWPSGNQVSQSSHGPGLSSGASCLAKGSAQPWDRGWAPARGVRGADQWNRRTMPMPWQAMSVDAEQRQEERRPGNCRASHIEGED